VLGLVDLEVVLGDVDVVAASAAASNRVRDGRDGVEVGRRVAELERARLGQAIDADAGLRRAMVAVTRLAQLPEDLA